MNFRPCRAVIALLALAFATTVSAQEKWLKGDNYYGCRTKDSLSRFVSMLSEKDFGAAGQMVAAGECRKLSGRVPVFLEDTAIFSGAVKIRPKGSTTGWWTIIEAVK